ncbi:MAG: exo-alpha-sialidase [Acidobacteria bacterium]|nr:exo-alpha-sialidase [Acidobacteriota bacterium]
MHRRSFLRQSSALLALAPAESSPKAAATQPGMSAEAKGVVMATDFQSRVVFRGRERYAGWIAFFPGENGQWYITCEEIWKSDRKLPRMTPQQTYEWSLPVKYDESQFERELVMLESRNNLKTWRVISRQPCRVRHSAGTFAQARTTDRLFLRFGWATQWMDPKRPHGKIMFTSSDNGKNWQEQPEFHDGRFVSYAHRLRTLRDGTLVLALPFDRAWGKGTDFPVRAASNLNAEHEVRMTLCFSYDQGLTWTSPLPIYAGYSVTETDFVELPSGDLLGINFMSQPGRQIIYRTQHGWVPNFYEKCPHNKKAFSIPETVCLIPEEILIGCRRSGAYFWSEDLGLTWYRLEGIPDRGQRPEVYQPWIHYLRDGRIACAGHQGFDSYYGELDQYVNLHTFKLKVLRRTKAAHIEMERDFDETKSRWKNAYTLKFDLRRPTAGRQGTRTVVCRTLEALL